MAKINTAKIGTKVLFIAGFGPIDHDVAKSRALYGDSLGVPFKEDAGGYLYTGALEGAKHFALWPLSQAAQSCFGRDSWPDNIPVPQARQKCFNPSAGYRVITATLVNKFAGIPSHLMGQSTCESNLLGRPLT